VVDIRFLADVPEHVDQLADWHHAQWRHLFEDWTHEVARTELLDHTLRKTLPTTLVLLENEVLVGSVSLLEDDAIELSAIGNAWLASLYVKPDKRGSGFGAQLVNALIDHARSLSLKEIFLFTPDHKGFYLQLGWQELQLAKVNGEQVDVMNYRISETVE
jgi:N-acetylglutamate synthase-like GNAT family acetyltransferase